MGRDRLKVGNSYVKLGKNGSVKTSKNLVPPSSRGKISSEEFKDDEFENYKVSDVLVNALTKAITKGDYKPIHYLAININGKEGFDANIVKNLDSLDPEYKILFTEIMKAMPALSKYDFANKSREDLFESLGNNKILEVKDTIETAVEEIILNNKKHKLGVDQFSVLAFKYLDDDKFDLNNPSEEYFNSQDDAYGLFSSKEALLKITLFKYSENGYERSKDFNPEEYARKGIYKRFNDFGPVDFQNIDQLEEQLKELNLPKGFSFSQVLSDISSDDLSEYVAEGIINITPIYEGDDLLIQQEYEGAPYLMEVPKGDLRGKDQSIDFRLDLEKPPAGVEIPLSMLPYIGKNINNYVGGMSASGFETTGGDERWDDPEEILPLDKDQPIPVDELVKLTLHEMI